MLHCRPNLMGFLFLTERPALSFFFFFRDDSEICYTLLKSLSAIYIYGASPSWDIRNVVEKCPPFNILYCRFF